MDDVPDEDLAAAAAAGVREAGLAPRGEEEEAAPVCALPAPAFEQTCIEIDAVADTAAAVKAASTEMFVSLGDPNTFLMSRSEYEALLSRLERSVPYSGIGLRLGLLDGTVPCHALSERCRLVVAEVYAGSPAEKAGLMADDIVLSLDDYVPSGSGCGLGGLGSFEPGRLVRVDVERDGRAMSFMVEADLVYEPAAAGRTVPGKTGYLRLGSFSARADRALAWELRTLLDSRIETLVVDLRGNPGGLLADGHQHCQHVSQRPAGRSPAGVQARHPAPSGQRARRPREPGGASHRVGGGRVVGLGVGGADAGSARSRPGHRRGDDHLRKEHRPDHPGRGIAPRNAAGRSPGYGVQVVGPRWRERDRRHRARRGTRSLGLLASDRARSPGGGRGGAARRHAGRHRLGHRALRGCGGAYCRRRARGLRVRPRALLSRRSDPPLVDGGVAGARRGRPGSRASRRLEFRRCGCQPVVGRPCGAPRRSWASPWDA